MKDVSRLFVAPESTLRDVLVVSNATRRGIVLVVDGSRRLAGVITDGDIRRAMLENADQATPVAKLLARKGAARPITAPAGAAHAELVDIVRRTGVSQIPLVSAEGAVEGLVAIEDLLAEDELALSAVVMAGGQGTRLHPLTQDTPKPMLPLGDRPLMERIIEQLSSTGIREVNVTTHYLADKITDHFGDGSQFGVRLNYVPEDDQLGTAGGLSLMPTPETPLLVINGDILTQVNFRAMLQFHREQGAALTLAVRPYEVTVPYGVVHSDGARVREVVEKPTYRHFVNAGIYLLEPAVHALVPKNQRFDMTDLIRAVLGAGKVVASFPIWEYWRDIGQHKDYLAAQADIKDGTLGP
jgi:dTDP-glucose pyrophosphorylase